MRKKYAVSLGDGQRAELDRVVRSGVWPARKVAHARVLLGADDGETDAEVAEAVGVAVATVERVRKRFAEGGLEASLDRRPQPPRPRKKALDGAGEARLIALACSPPPLGRAVWTMQLLADKLVELEVVDSISDETVRLALKKTRAAPLP